MSAAAGAGGTAVASAQPLLSPLVLVCSAGFIAFLLSAALGANDVANALGTSVGTGAVSITKALAIGAVCEFSGAVLFGSTVTKTISSGVVSISASTLANPSMYMLGMSCVLVGCTSWLGIATALGLPVSSTHSVVGSLVGLGLASGWLIKWSAVGNIAASWVVSPLIGGVVATALFAFIKRTIIDAPRPTRAMRRWLPLLCGTTLFLLTLFLQIEGERPLHWTVFQAVASSAAVAAFGAGMSGALTNFIHCQKVEQLRNSNNSNGGRGGGRASPASEAPDLVSSTLAEMSEGMTVSQAASGMLRDDDDAADDADDDAGTDSKDGVDAKQAAAAGTPAGTGGDESRGRQQAARQDGENTVLSSTSLTRTTQSRKRQHDIVEQVFSILQLLTACFVSFSHGSNDVSNAIGPFAAILAAYSDATAAAATSSSSAVAAAAAVGQVAVIPPWVLVLGGLGISFGLGVWGRPVMDTVGKKITHLVPTRGFCVELATALTVLMATQLGLPVSTTHTLIGCIVAMGLVTGHGQVNRRVLASIVLSWCVTVPVSAALTAACFAALRMYA